ncbi:MAG: phosphatidylglycerophosphatase A [Bdellovibrionota bacterium]
MEPGTALNPSPSEADVRESGTAFSASRNCAEDERRIAHCANNGFTMPSPLTRFADFVATGFYSGRAPAAPGTAGTAVACVLSYLLFQAAPELSTFPNTVILAVGVSAIAFWSAHTVWKSGLYGESKDPQAIVIDEFAGYAITIIGGLPSGWFHYLLAFALFRLFDILKPPPCRTLEKLVGGIGIVADDLMAGIYALICRQLIETLLFSSNI